jgi:hypothetical protein
MFTGKRGFGRRVASRLAWALLFSIGLQPIAWAQEEGLQIVGFDGAKQKYLLNDFSLDEFSCAEGRFSLHVDSIDVGETLSLNLTDELGSGASDSFSAEGTQGKFHGVDVWRYTLDAFPFGQRPGPLTLIAPMDQKDTVSVDSHDLCPSHGFLPNLIWVVADPTQADTFEAWLVKKKFAIATPPSETGLNNMWVIKVPAGQENLALEAMRKEKWFIDAKRYSAGAGPEDIYVEFPNNGTFQASASQKNAHQALASALQDTFGDAFDPVALTNLPGTYFEWHFLEPANVVIPDDSRFDGRWLEADLRFLFSPEPEEHWFVLIQAADGYLPRWDRATPPPAAHVHQAHLDKDGADEMSDFTVLFALQNRIATAFADQWNGEAYTRD